MTGLQGHKLSPARLLASIVRQQAPRGPRVSRNIHKGRRLLLLPSCAEFWVKLGWAAKDRCTEQRVDSSGHN